MDGSLTTEQQLPGAAAALTTEQASIDDRRRPGRVNYDNPDLISLMRQVDVAEDARPDQADCSDQSLDDGALNVTRGIIKAAMFGLMVWAGIGYAVWHFLSR